MQLLNQIEPTLLGLYTNESFSLIKATVPHWSYEEQNNPDQTDNQTYLLSPDFLTPIPMRSLFGWTIESFDNALIEVCRTIVETQHGDNCHWIIPNPDFNTWYPEELNELRQLLSVGGTGIVIPDWMDAFVLNGILNRIGWRLQRLFELP